MLEFMRRVLPENHPDIGEGHVRSGDALALLNLTFAFTGTAFFIQAVHWFNKLAGFQTRTLA